MALVTLVPVDLGKMAVLHPGCRFWYRDVHRAKKRRSGGATGSLSPVCPHLQFGRGLRQISVQGPLSDGPSSRLSAVPGNSMGTSRGGGGCFGHYFMGGLADAKVQTLLADGLVVVFGDAAAGNWPGAGGSAGPGRSLLLPAVNRGVHSRHFWAARPGGIFAA